MQLQYKGFSATVRYSAATEGFYGEVTDTPAALSLNQPVALNRTVVALNHTVIAFQSSHLDEVESAFQEAVERYLRHVRFLSLGVQAALAQF